MRGSRCTLRLSASVVLLALAPAAGLAQGGQRGQTQRPTVNAADDPLLRGYRWRAIGPINQGGRIDDIAVAESRPTTFYVGFATGGVWKTTNNGVTFEPVFDTYGTHSIGDLALAPSNPDILYVGTGEPNNRQSSSFGDGIYKSSDGGRTFTHAGLRETQTIARIVVHPTNPEIVWVAANGHLFGPNAERGIFMSSNGGRSWDKVLYVDENTGATDLVIDPSNANTLFAATYQRRRTAWGFASGGPASGIWKSENGGRNWTRVSGGGLPTGSMGRIGLDFSRSNPNVLYAQIETTPDDQPAQPAPQGGRRGGGGGGGGGGGQEPAPDARVSGIWRSANKGQTWQFASNQNNRPMYYSQIRVDPNNENVVYVGGASASKSTDGGRTWQQLGGFGHGDHHAIWIDPANSNHVMYGNDGSLDVSWDGAQTWESFRAWEVGQPYHASVDMRRPYYVCTGLQDNGSWCGPSSVRSNAILSQDWYRVGGGDGFYSQVDPTDWTVLYTESQNGNMNRYDLRAGTNVSIRPRQAGQRGGGAPNIVPAPPPACTPETTQNCTDIRWNWNTPILLSPHDPSTVYAGGSRLFISNNRGQTWRMTTDLTKAIAPDSRDIMGMRGALPGCSRARVGACIHSKNDGVSDYGTIVTVAESPAVRGILWVGTDDGNIQLSRDGGATWTEVGRNLPGGPKEYYVSRVEASYFEPATAYVSLDGHRSDDLRPYIFVTRDFGQTWTSISSNLPAWGNVNTVKQDPKNRSLLYAGTEFGFFASFDEGRSWKRFMTNLPVVRIDDVIVHPRDNDLVLATHGRSVWIMDDITALQQLTAETMTQDAALLEPREAVLWKTDVRLARSVTGAQNWRGEVPPAGTAISYYLRTAPGGDVRITISSPDGQVFRSMSGTRDAGLNRVHWNLRGNPVPPTGGGGGGGGGEPAQGPLAAPGVYTVTLSVGGREYTRAVAVLEDVWMDVR